MKRTCEMSLARPGILGLLGLILIVSLIPSIQALDLTNAATGLLGNVKEEDCVKFCPLPNCEEAKAKEVDLCQASHAGCNCTTSKPLVDGECPTEPENAKELYCYDNDCLEVTQKDVKNGTICQKVKNGCTCWTVFSSKNPTMICIIVFSTLLILTIIGVLTCWCLHIACFKKKK